MPVKKQRLAYPSARELDFRHQRFSKLSRTESTHRSQTPYFCRDAGREEKPKACAKARVPGNKWPLVSLKSQQEGSPSLDMTQKLVVSDKETCHSHASLTKTPAGKSKTGHPKATAPLLLSMPSQVCHVSCPCPAMLTNDPVGLDPQVPPTPRPLQVSFCTSTACENGQHVRWSQNNLMNYK